MTANMKLDNPTERLVNLVCSDFVDALINQPTTHYSKITHEDINILSGTLHWPQTETPSVSSKSDPLVYDDLVKLSMIRIVDSAFNPKLSVVTFNASDWTLGPSQTLTLSDAKDYRSVLPDGLQEFLAQVEALYGKFAVMDSRISRADVIDTIVSSEHMVIIFPHIIRFSVRELRENIRTDSVELTLELLDAVLSNAYYEIKSSGEFHVILSCLLDIIIANNLMVDSSRIEEHRLSVRRQASDILTRFLKTKLGVYHSSRLVQDILDSILLPFIEDALADLAHMASPCAGATCAAARLSLEFLGIPLATYYNQISKLVAMTLSTRGRSGDSVSLDAIEECLRI
jgi:hypothetical protein